eukprot:CAMPEP_0204258280 /NCGR_PEP_ID=MMETSP0468-20130131/4897_1 /ASSEMBLY_ACC=CAM_ASM_000383 /TAXON_ID=2969 /ORGANISM="Oxyrrhis marina" /LENGTH=513 /DNA_ID=CAMNT_0051232463 /DNA_START=19 /DNA_END=1561 /DNA_ORIENTATION=-
MSPVDGVRQRGYFAAMLYPAPPGTAQLVRDAQRTVSRNARQHCEALASRDVSASRHGAVHLFDALGADDVAGLALAMTESGQVPYGVRSGCSKVVQSDLERTMFVRSTRSEASIAAVADLVAEGVVLPAVAVRSCSLHGRVGDKSLDRLGVPSARPPEQSETAVCHSGNQAVATSAVDASLRGSSSAASVTAEQWVDSQGAPISPSSGVAPSVYVLSHREKHPLEAILRRQWSLELPKKQEIDCRRSSMPVIMLNSQVDPSESAGLQLGDHDFDNRANRWDVQPHSVAPIDANVACDESALSHAESCCPSQRSGQSQDAVIPDCDEVSTGADKQDAYVQVRMNDGTWRTGRIEGVLPGEFFGMTFWRSDGSHFRARIPRRAPIRRVPPPAQDTLAVGSSVQVQMPNGVWRRGQVHQGWGLDGIVVRFSRRDGSRVLMQVPRSAAVRPDQQPTADRHVEIKIGEDWAEAFLVGASDTGEFRVRLAGGQDSAELVVPGDTPVRPMLRNSRQKQKD